jgi:myo-inositol-1(or 4)-monophosphatase
MPSFAEAAVAIAREAGNLLRYHFERRVDFELKGEFDLVTEADRASEKLVVERLKQLFPTHSVMAEEGTGEERGSEYRWYVDPLDGTTNFAHGYPVWNVTLALEKAGELVAGVIFDPSREELFAAEKGAGAFLNGRRLRVSKTSRVQDALVSTGFPNWNRGENPNILFYHQFAMSSHGVRRCGSAAIDLSCVASGRLDAFWEIGLNPWDLAAGKLLVEEAGGVCTDMHGAPHHMKSHQILVDNGGIHEEMIKFFAEIFQGKMRYPLPKISPAT